VYPNFYFTIRVKNGWPTDPPIKLDSPPSILTFEQIRACGCVAHHPRRHFVLLSPKCYCIGFPSFGHLLYRRPSLLNRTQNPAYTLATRNPIGKKKCLSNDEYSSPSQALLDLSSPKAILCDHEESAVLKLKLQKFIFLTLEFFHFPTSPTLRNACERLTNTQTMFPKHFVFLYNCKKLLYRRPPLLYRRCAPPYRIGAAMQ